MINKIKMASSMRYYYLLILIILLGSCHTGLTTRPFNTIAEMVEISKNTGKPGFIFLTVPGCDMCEIFEYKTLQNEEVREYINNNFTFYKIDVSKNNIFNKILYNYSFPNILITDKDKLELLIKTENDPKKFIASLKNYKAQPFHYNLAQYVKLEGENELIASALNNTFKAFYCYEKGDMDKSISFIQESLEHSPYFFNTFLYADILKTQGNQLAADSVLLELSENISAFDEHLYAYEVAKVYELANEQGKNLASVEFEKITHDFGRISDDKTVYYSFKLTNTGEEPLLIKYVRNSCGCTVTEYPDYPILPGKTAEITAAFTPQEKGKFHKSISVVTNTKERRTELFITGEVG